MSPEDRIKQWSVASVMLMAAIWIILWKVSLKSTLDQIDEAFSEAPPVKVSANDSTSAPWSIVKRILTFDNTDGEKDPPPFSLSEVVFTPILMLLEIIGIAVLMMVGVNIIQEIILQFAFTGAVDINPLSIVLISWMQEQWMFLARVFAICMTMCIGIWIIGSLYLRDQLRQQSFARSLVVAMYAMQPAAALAIYLYSYVEAMVKIA